MKTEKTDCNLKCFKYEKFTEFIQVVHMPYLWRIMSDISY